MAYASFQKPIEDIIECPICTETLRNTRVLPCIHTFCLQCISKYGENKKPGDTVRCPCCRNEFHVPIGGFVKLPKNTVIEKLLEVQCALTTEWNEHSSRICTMPGHGKKNKNQSLATWHCDECKQHMCGRCRSVHLRQGRTSFHHVLPVQSENRCQDHPDKQLDRFCKTCETPVCGECCASNHKGHDWNTFVNYVATLQMEIEKLRSRNTQLSSQMNRQNRELPLSLNANHNDARRPVIVYQVAADDDRIRSRLREKQETIDILVAFVILLVAFISQSRDLMDEERASWLSEKNKYALVEETLKRQIQTLTAELDKERERWPSEKRNDAVSKAKLKREVKDLIVKQKENLLLIRRMEKYIDKVQYTYYPALTKIFQLQPAESRAVVALTLIDGKLLIANSINGDLKLRDAYSVTKETDWATIPSSTVAGMGICRKNGQVFVSTWDKYIFRFNRDGQLLDQWPLDTVASGVISVTDDCNVVLAVRDNSKKILIYSNYGEMINEVEMKEDILESRLIKAVQISNGHFLVSYGEGEDPEHGIDIIDANGQTLKSYGRRKGAGIGQLRDPRDFVVDRLGNVLVADSGNGRILLLDSELNFQRELVSMEHGLQHPFGILLNEFANLLYVVDNQWDPTKKEWTDGRIMVFNIK